MKYRLLTPEELEELKPEFINFLAANTITADDYKRLQENDPEKVKELITIFSDIVMEKVLSKITFLEHRETNSLMAFECLDDRMVLIGLNIQGEANLKDDSFIKEINENPEKLNDLQVEIFKTEKPYRKEKEQEIFELVQSGAMVSDGNMYQLLKAIKQ
ncbi:DUF6495 family protein [Cytophagaceae bacterium ABcell3]|nr:DUF6495 family protein [Cytophagaceae bacterium ABcell3]